MIIFENIRGTLWAPTHMGQFKKINKRLVGVSPYAQGLSF